MKTLLKEASGYGVASGCALIVDVAILWGSVRFLSVGYLLAATISFLAGSVVSYKLSVNLAFKQHRFRDRETEFFSFVAIGAVGVAVNGTVIFLAVTYIGLHHLAAKCVAAGFTFWCNFIVRRQILFVPRRTLLREDQ